MTDDPRDDWLRAALRHAPDPGAPPEALRDAIFREARRPLPPAVAPLPWWARTGRWLMQPQAAAGFASVVVMTTAGLLWWDEPLPPMSPPDATVSTAADAPPPVVQPQPAPGSRPLPAPPPRLALPEPVPPSPAPEARRAPSRASPAARAEREDTAPVLAAPPPAAAPPAKPLPDRTAPSGTLSAAATPPAPVVQAEAAEKRSAASSFRQRADAGVPQPMEARVIAVRDKVALAPERWTWQRAGEPARPADTALLTWLEVLDAGTAGLWAPEAAARAGHGEASLLRDGQVVHRWVFSADGVTWFDGSGSPTRRHATLPEPTVRRLSDALAGLP